jgi:hypothetical protein
VHYIFFSLLVPLLFIELKFARFELDETAPLLHNHTFSMLGGNSRIDRIIKPSITRIKRPPKRARRDEEDLELQQAVNSETTTQMAFTTRSQAAGGTLNMLELPQHRDTLYDNEGNGDSFEFTTPPPVSIADNVTPAAETLSEAVISTAQQPPPPVTGPLLRADDLPRSRIDDEAGGESSAEHRQG